ncbi:MAG: anaerobic ribonucleoside-triphosphate reductase [Candidatus Dojkabacteria bacterium]|nr:anaerobic ribonucleoside-triphosphate reductase [Candidatus Dojkabacteria bacterium]
MLVKNSNGEYEEYNPQQIKNNILTICKKYNETIDEKLVESIISNLYVYDKMETKEIRQQIENALMSVNKKVAKKYIQYYGSKEEQQKNLKKQYDFIKNYINASNAATGSTFDPNANVSSKNIATLANELYKEHNIKQNRWILHNKITALFGKKIADEYIADLESHRLYKHDETVVPGMPYCVSITMYPFLIDGLKKLGGPSGPPTDTKSFCGEFINLVYSISSQFAGAVATPEFLLYMDYFLRKDYGENYYQHTDQVVDLSRKKRTLEKTIENFFQQVVHSMNMPAGNRGYQSVFWNIGYFDSYYFKGIFDGFVFPDGTTPKWESLNWLQKKFMKWFNKEREKYLLTFPVETVALLSDGKKILDEEYEDFICEMWAEGHSFFCYISDSPDSLSSCCRLRNEIDKKNTHQFSMGTASVATGSKSVMTINLNRIIQDAVRKIYDAHQTNSSVSEFYQQQKEFVLNTIRKDIKHMVQKVHKYQIAFNEIIKDFYKANMLDAYSAGYIDMKKQYLTIGVNGLTDAAEFLGIPINDNEDYKQFVNVILETIYKCNKAARTDELMFNTEFVPGENLSHKNYNWDKKDGYYVSPKHQIYSSYFFNPEDASITVLDALKLHGKEYVQYLDGGSACHINLQEHLTKNQYKKLLSAAVQFGTNYFTFNVQNTYCNDCGFIDKHTRESCSKCGSKNIDYVTRIIGYLKKISCFSEGRQKEAAIRNYKKL